MPYDPKSLKPGDVVLIEGRGPLAAAIKWSTGSPFSHAAIVGDGKIIEALWSVTASPLEKYAQTGWAFRVDAASDLQRAAAVRWATARLGARYGVGEILCDLERFDLHRQPRPHSLQRYTCSGLVAQAYRAAGLFLTLAPWPAPSDLSYSPALVGERPWPVPDVAIPQPPPQPATAYAQAAPAPTPAPVVPPTPIAPSNPMQ